MGAEVGAGTGARDGGDAARAGSPAATAHSGRMVHGTGGAPGEAGRAV